ncbi:MAG TPA: organomercurial lyase [Sporichthyaceae bacterium]|nr:organomercurial lyase [Sporichthyaceae bacterium]
MLLTVLSVPGCPNTNLLVGRVRTALGTRPADLEVVVINEEDGARRWGMTGSPTLLVGGVDPFPAAGLEPSVSCRLYRSADSSLWGVPSVAELEAVFVPRPGAPAREGRVVDIAGRGGRGRLAPVEGGLRAVQRATLRAMADTGVPPCPAEVDRVAEPFGRSGTDVLRALAFEDFLTLDQVGHLRAVYPFSIPPTRHLVRMEDGPQVWAMCAIDALGIPGMIDRAVTIDTTDPITAQPITVCIPRDGVRAVSAGPVVFVGRRGRDGPAEQTCCEVINFFSSRHSAARWAALNVDAGGEILELDVAAELGQVIFGGLLK